MIQCTFQPGGSIGTGVAVYIKQNIGSRETTTTNNKLRVKIARVGNN